MIIADIRTDNWIKVSVFYRKKCWRQFIADYLNPYISVQREHGNISGVYIGFDEFRGDSIELAFEYTGTDLSQEQFTGLMATQLTNYLTLHPSGPGSDVYKGYLFFMDFPNDSVQLDVFYLSFSEEVWQLQLLISERILTVFAEDEFENDTVISFMLYVVMVFCAQWEIKDRKENIGTVAGLDKSRIAEKIADLLKLKDGVFEDTEYAAHFEPYKRLFDENGDLIAEMYQEVLQVGENNAESIELWPLVKYYQQGLSKPFIHAKNVLLPLDEIVMNQLCMEYSALLAIYYLVYLSLESELAI